MHGAAFHFDDDANEINSVITSIIFPTPSCHFLPCTRHGVLFPPHTRRQDEIFPTYECRFEQDVFVDVFHAFGF